MPVAAEAKWTPQERQQELQQKFAAYQQRANELQIAALIPRIARQKSDLRKRLVALYRLGGLSYVRMVLALEGPHRKAVRAMQQFLSESAWDDEAILARHWQEVERELGDDDGVLLPA